MEEVDASLMQNPVTKSWVAARYSLVEEGGAFKRRCKFVNCRKEYSRGTSHMILKRHWAKQHSEQFITQTTTEGRTRTISTSCHPNSTINQNIDNNGKATKKKRIKPNDSQHLSPLKCSNSNNKVTSDKIQAHDVKLVAKRLKEAPSIHLSFEIHGGKKGGKVFGIVAAHSFVEGDLQTVLLEYRHLPYPNDTTAIVEFLRACISKFNIREKVVSIATSCSECVLGSVAELDKKLKLSKNFNFSTCHMRCFPQFVHLNMIEVLKTQDAMIEQIRQIVGMINASQYICIQHVQHEENVALPTDNGQSKTSDSGQTNLKLLTDNKSYWNTTYDMMENFLQHQDVIEASVEWLRGSTPPQTHQMDLQNFSFDWKKLFGLFQLLKPFQDIIKRFATDNYVPPSIVSALLQPLINHLSRQWCSPDLDIAAHNLKMQLEMYRQTFLNDLTTIAAVLDPRIKLSFIPEEQRAEIPALLRSKFISPILPQDFEPPDSIFKDAFVEELEEVDSYLTNPREHKSTDIFSYWEAMKNSWPNLYALARVLLCIQVTSVANDRMFSAAENLDKERKVQMDSYEARELNKSWGKFLKSKKR